jgi:hypothetical protein
MPSTTTVALLTIVALLLLLAWHMAAAEPTATSVADARRPQRVTLTPPAAGGAIAATAWIYVDDWNYRLGEPKTVMKIGDKGRTSEGCIMEMRLAPAQNDLEILVPTIATHTGTGQGDYTPFKCTVRDIPLQRWTLATASLSGRTLDVYINGKLARTCALPALPTQNGGTELTVTPNGGFAGWTAKAQTGPPISPRKETDTYTDGPGTAMGSGMNNWKIQIAVVPTIGNGGAGNNSEKGKILWES